MHFFFFFSSLLAEWVIQEAQRSVYLMNAREDKWRAFLYFFNLHPARTGEKERSISKVLHNEEGSWKLRYIYNLRVKFRRTWNQREWEDGGSFNQSSVLRLAFDIMVLLYYEQRTNPVLLHFCTEEKETRSGIIKWTTKILLLLLHLLLSRQGNIVRWLQLWALLYVTMSRLLFFSWSCLPRRHNERAGPFGCSPASWLRLLAAAVDRFLYDGRSIFPWWLFNGFSGFWLIEQREDAEPWMERRDSEGSNEKGAQLLRSANDGMTGILSRWRRRAINCEKSVGMCCCCCCCGEVAGNEMEWSVDGASIWDYTAKSWTWWFLFCVNLKIERMKRKCN